MLKLISSIHNKKKHVREAESLKNKDGERFSNQQKTASTNCGAISE